MENTTTATATATAGARTKRPLRALAATAVAAAALALNLVSAAPSSASAPGCSGVPSGWDHLTQGMCLRGGEQMSSPIQYGSEGLVTTEEANVLSYQRDGNLVVSHWKTWIPPEVGGAPDFSSLVEMIERCAASHDCQDGDTVIDILWNSGTQGRSTGEAVMQADGNFVVYDGNGNSAWSSGTYQCGSSYVWGRMQTDGNFVLYKGHAAGDNNWKPVWSTKNGRTAEPC
ncbi:hypothetical protein [Kitasatospora sp. NPDC094011]|uniref:hypothetical protein n=1 Tax=Kitasatospora sp. NPDC094011 TaxID=3364090 RepID=UPI00380D5945